MNPHVEIEEDFYDYQPPENGAGPMWCQGNTCIVRAGEEVFASGLYTVPGAKPLNNCLPLLYRRSAEGWRQIFRHGQRTREPSPLACTQDGHIYLSLNPSIAPVEAVEGPAEPQIARFSTDQGSEPARRSAPEILMPEWDGAPGFTEHSYRSFAADGERDELILFQNVDKSHVEFAFLDAHGQWASQGRLEWPWGAEYERPQPVRICYPNVQLKDRAVWFCGVSDIEEPNPRWRDFKRALTGSEWDFDFRRLFFTWCDDIVTGRFHEWTEISSRERTCGWIMPCDMHVDDARNVHIMWTERAIDERLRERFFPLERQSHNLHYAVLRDGIVIFRRVISGAEAGDVPGSARFQSTPDGRLFALYHLGEGTPGARNVVREILPDGVLGTPALVPLTRPLPRFFTATVRAGCRPSTIVDMIGDVGNTMRYARVWLD